MVDGSRARAWRTQSAAALGTATLLAWAACSNDTTEPGGVGGGATGPVTLQGGAHKGPLVLGSTVMVSMLDGTGNPAGQVFNTITLSDLGEFTVVVSEPGNAELIAQGYYFNEATGELSGASITLHALASIVGGGTQQSYLNVVTHMAYRRALHLHQAGAALPDAVAQAESELREALGIAYPGTAAAAGTSMNLLGGDTPDSQYLFAVSCVLAAASTSDAELQELINGVTLDLEPDGALDGALVQLLADAQRAFDPSVCASNLAERIAATGSSVLVPTIDQAWDTDGDGTSNADDDDDDDDGTLDDEDCAPVNPAVGAAWCDPGNGLCWSPITEKFWELSWADATAYCDDLARCGSADWHLPTVSEFRSLFRGCPATAPDGACGLEDGCVDSECWTDACNGCAALGGPGDLGCYIDPDVLLPPDLNDNCGAFFTGQAGWRVEPQWARFVDNPPDLVIAASIICAWQP